MRNDETTQILWTALAVGVGALIVLLWAAGFRFWPALAWAILVAALVALLLWVLRDKADAPEEWAPMPVRPAPPPVPEVAREPEAVAPPAAVTAPDPAPVAEAPAVSRMPRGRKGADSMPRPANDRRSVAARGASAGPAEPPTDSPLAFAEAARPWRPAPMVARGRKGADSMPRPDRRALRVAVPPPASPEPPRAADNLKAIKGIGPKIERQLHAMGITTFAQIAAWTEADVHRVEGDFGFPGRIRRDDWVAQAVLLAAGGSTEFANRVKQGDVY